MNNQKKTITTLCEAGICPICGGTLEYDDPDMHNEYKPWTCSTCGATGREGFQSKEPAENDDGCGEWEEYVEFDGTHFDVHLKNGTPVVIYNPATGRQITKELRPVEIEAVCKQGVCPICNSKLEDTGDTRYTKYGYESKWKCPVCGATGWEEYTEETAYSFSGDHNDVKLKDGTPVDIVTPPAPEGVLTWKIPVSWEMCGYVYIEAPTLAEAMDTVRNDNDDIPLPEGNYVDGSFCLSYEEKEEIRSLHNNGQADTTSAGV